jgi:hypothetical protein
MPLLVKTQLKEIPNKGIGVISVEKIKINTIVYRDDLNFDILLSQEQVDRMPDTLKSFVDTYCSFIKEYNSYYVCMDNSRFLNHSFNANLKWDDVDKKYIANRDIDMGEELTSNYTEFDEFSKRGEFGFEIYE